jgi:hypothetical protein
VPPEIKDYWRFRRGLQELSGRILSTMTPEVFKEAGVALGVFEDGRYLFPNELALGVLYDSCLYDWPDSEGGSVVARYAERVAGTRLPDPDAILLEAMLHARYAIFRLEEMLPGVGARVVSEVDDKELRLVEPTLTHMPEPVGQWWVSRLFYPAGRCMTMGTAILLGKPPLGEREAMRDLVRRTRPKWRSDRDMAIFLARHAILQVAGRHKPEDELRFPEGDIEGAQL